MAVYKIFPIKDASIYTQFPNMNTGLDEMLECSVYQSLGNQYISRYLIKFDTNEIEKVIDEIIDGKNFNVNIKNYKALIEGLNTDVTLNILPLSGSWDNGTGRFQDSPQTTNGVSWMSQNINKQWDINPTNQFVTSSYQSIPGGGTWFTGSNIGLNVVHSQSLSLYSKLDLDVDVTNTILTWYSGGFDNEGFIIKQSEETEFNSNINNQIKFFSRDTHTIYPPFLEFKYDDFSYSGGNLPEINTNSLLISLKDNKPKFYSNEIIRMRLSVSPRYPQRIYRTTSPFILNHRLPSGSTYAIKDTRTNEFVVDFDDTYTRLNCDNLGNYFDLHMGGLQPERNYTILIKTNINNSKFVYDQNITFKVING